MRMGRREGGFLEVLRRRRRRRGTVGVMVLRGLEMRLVGVMVVVGRRRRKRRLALVDWGRRRRSRTGVTMALFLAVNTLVVGPLVEALAVFLLHHLLTSQLLKFLLRVDLINLLLGVLSVLQPEADEGGGVVYVLVGSQEGLGLEVAVHVIGLVVASGLFASGGARKGMKFGARWKDR